MLRNLVKTLGRPVLREIEARRGPFESQRKLRREGQPRLDLRQGILEIEKKFPAAGGASEDSPIILLSAGWRAGSTLLQRVLMSGGESMIWGEPFSQEGFIESLGDPIMRFGLGASPFHKAVDKSIAPKEYSGKWVATVAPPLDDLRAGLVACLDRVFGSPAREMGVSRWGIKEVRIGPEYAYLFRWLYPRAKILFLYRNPYDAYTSFRGSLFYRRWPDQPVCSPAAFGNHWRQLLEPMLEHAGELGARVIKYEDLIGAGFDMDDLARFVDLPLDRSVLSQKIGSSRRPKSSISSAEMRVLRRSVEPLASRLGYTS